jgi:hypothetical protein
MAYAIIKIQNPSGIKDYVMAFFRNMLKEKKQEKDEKNEDLPL